MVLPNPHLGHVNEFSSISGRDLAEVAVTKAARLLHNPAGYGYDTLQSHSMDRIELTFAHAAQTGRLAQALPIIGQDIRHDSPSIARTESSPSITNPAITLATRSTPDLDEALSNVSLTTTERNNVLAAVNTALPKQYNVTDAYFENGILNVQYLNANNRSDDRIREFEIAQVKDILMDKSVQVAHNQEQTLQMDLVARQQSQGQSLSL